MRLQLSSRAQRSDAFAVMRAMGLAANPLALYTGALACAVRDAGFSAILFPLYAGAKSLIAERAGLEGAPLFLIAGTLAATPAAFLTTPADIVKTRLQQEREINRVAEQGSDAGAPAAGAPTPPAMGAFAIVRRIVTTEGGIPALFQGGCERVLRSAPQFGVTLALFEIFKRVCAHYGWLASIEPSDVSTHII